VRKTAVDPNRPTTFQMTSDQFFAANKQAFDIIFIDGLHYANQVLRDIQNALRSLKTGGVVVCHDLNPQSEEMQKVPRTQMEWTGDCWRAWVQFRSQCPYEMYVLDCDYGVGIIDAQYAAKYAFVCPDLDLLTYNNFDIQRIGWLNLREPAQWLNSAPPPALRKVL
jgi:SAM-dependent methyltransferase